MSGVGRRATAAPPAAQFTLCVDKTAISKRRRVFDEKLPQRSVFVG